MPFNLIDTDCSPLVIDYEYEIADKSLLAERVGEMLLGHHYHILKIINTLTVSHPIHNNDAINATINQLKSATVTKRDGWMFQMISWMVLATRNRGEKFYANYPHFAPAQHGIDGLALILSSTDELVSIIITEDKCTTQPRGKITSQVFPEFLVFEEGKKNNALIGIIASLISNLNSGQILEKVQNDIFNKDYRIYRIGITREETHNDKNGRNMLFLNYDKHVKGDAKRRNASSIYIKDLRNWMEDLADKVIIYLESKKTT